MCSDVLERAWVDNAHVLLGDAYDRAQNRLDMRFPPFDFQNGGRRIKNEHVIEKAVAPLFPPCGFCGLVINNLLAIDDRWKLFAKESTERCQ